MMISNPIELDKFLRQIRERYTAQNISPNPFFYLVKPTRENLQKYNLRKINNGFGLFWDLVLFIPTVINYQVQSFAISILMIKESNKFTSNDLKKTNKLVISHFTYAQKASNEDIFFGHNVNDDGTLVFYLNSTRLQAQDIHDGYVKAGKNNQVINTKSLNPFKIIQLHLYQNKLMFSLIMIALSESSISICKRRLLIKGALWQHHRATVANLVLRERLLSVISQTKPSKLILTIEGHSHEHMILESRNLKFKNIDVIGVQHAPIVAGQFSFFNLLNHFSKLDILLTSGSATQRQISKRTPNLDIRVLGSPKSLRIKPVIDFSSKSQILGAVEGVAQSLESFITLFNELASHNPQRNFVLRLHPALDRHEVKALMKKLDKRENLSVSKESLSVDLSNSAIVVFRSSAVGIEGLAYSALPIHFDPSGQSLLNPLVELNLGPDVFTTAAELSTYLKMDSNKDISIPSNQEKFFKLFNDYYGPLKDINQLID